MPDSMGKLTIMGRLVPLIFVVLWSTGFIGAKLGLPYAEPFTFLAVRMAITLAILLPLILVFVKQKPQASVAFHSMVSGALIHGFYLGAVFFAISRGMSAGISALIIALQPLVTILVARVMLGERLNGRQIAGLLVALFGVGLVLLPQLGEQAGSQGITISNVLVVCFSVVAISVGAVYQKKFVPALDLRMGAFFQYLGAFIPLAAMSFLFEERTIVWSGEFIFAMGWLVLVLSIGAVTLLMYLIRRDSATSTASLFYLVPVSTAIIAYFLFGEILHPIQIAGMAIVIVSVAKGMRT